MLLGVIAIYVAASLFGWLQGYLLNGIVQRTIFSLRREVEDKINRLPLRYFDRQQRGEVLSRVTNDIDNISQTLQQTMSQLLTSLLTVVGVLVMMVVISPLLALVALVTIPVSVFVTQAIAKRSQKQFVAQWRHTGALNAPYRGGVHRPRAGAGVRAAPRGGGGLHGSGTSGCSTPASGRSSSPGSSCRR